MLCPSCSAIIDDDQLTCPACGAAVDDSFASTRIQSADADEADETKIQTLSPTPISQKHPTTGRASVISISRFSSFDSLEETRFTMGAIVADRYRIIGLLGKGGMGEVYRADDLKLGIPVALKFLPENLANDGAMLARFHREVRIARQVSHPSVCRVYDIGEIGGQHFLSMEYIDGEDLSTLMRRIGRLPHDKAIEIARQICAGLAAAHDVGVLHRDLKPANIMLDGRGKAHIMDFGLAGIAEEIGSDDVRSGTPAYMAPEQLTGEEVSVKSDIYSLGLVLYEIFTGKRVYEAQTLADLMMLHEQSTPATPTAFVKEIDPLVEKIILRCLEKDPRRRPHSALQVAAALPGGDPLAAALAAGETPSPEMVAAAAKEGALTPAIALALLIAVVSLIAIILFLAPKTRLHDMVPLEKNADVLADRARTIAQKFGYTNPPADSTFGFGTDDLYLNTLVQKDDASSRWDKLSVGQPAAMYFWYRQSPRPLIPFNGRTASSQDPPPRISGMVSLLVDTNGRLLEFLAVPPQYDDSQDPSPAPDWTAIFNEAGLDIANFKSTDPKWITTVHSDKRAAWEGTYPEAPDVPLRIEAASYRGKPVYFSTLNEWDQPFRMTEFKRSGREMLVGLVFGLFIGSLVFAGAMVARRNLRLGRGDRKGAFRLALFIFATNLLGWAFLANHIASFGEETSLWTTAAAWALWWGGVVWIVYIALEPYVRRNNPERIIAWNRLLAGDLRDPLVGRDILIGAVLGLALALLRQLNYVAPKLFGMPTGKPMYAVENMFLGIRGVVGSFFQLQQSVIFTSTGLMLFFVLLSLLFKRERLAMTGVWLFIFGISMLENTNLKLIDTIFIAISAAFYVLAATRFGLLTLMAMQLFTLLFAVFPITPNFSAWYAQGSIVAIAIALAIAGFGFYTSLAGQKIFREEMLGD
jgi:serine/threonine-protein kinase